MGGRDFYPRPPGGGRRTFQAAQGPRTPISIHALRVEGDMTGIPSARSLPLFLSTPSGWRATVMSGMDRSAAEISIHALRVEGDDVLSGDKDQRFVFLSTPSGWRATCVRRATTKCTRFLSTPSGWRATLIDLMRCGKEMHFYPRPPGGGRRCDKRGGGYCYRFLSTPSGWRATSVISC